MMAGIGKAAALAAIVALAPLASQAATFQLSYLYGPLMTALVEGTLQADGNRVDVLSVTDIRFRGELTNFVLSPGSATATMPEIGRHGTATLLGQGVLSLDGTYLDLILCDYNCGAHFGFFPDPTEGYPQALATDAFSGDHIAPLIRNFYSLTQITSVPLPAGGGLLASGFGLLALRRKRR